MISANRKKQNRNTSQSLENSGAEHYKFIVTGFNSFGKNLENPSGLTALSLPSELIVGKHNVEIHGLLLETCCKSSWTTVRKELVKSTSKGSTSKPGVQKALSTVSPVASKNSNPQRERVVLILLGLAAVRSSLNLERFALNVRDYPIKDNHGHQFDGEQIMPGPLALKTEFPLVPLRKRLKSKGFPSIISNHAGTFVCNDVYYQSLTYQIENGTPDLVLFVHVPPARVFAESVRDQGRKDRVVSKRLTKAKQIELLQESILEVIRFSVNHLAEKPAGQSANGKSATGRSARPTVKQLPKKSTMSQLAKKSAAPATSRRKTG